MILTIWRHGEAAWAVDDRQRELTAAGTDDVGFGCHHFHDLCHERELPHPDLVLHSDWVRATQTADVISSAFTHAGMAVSAALRPGSTIGAVENAIGEVQAMPDCAVHLLLVTHQPLVSRLVDYLLGERGRVPSLSPGGFATMQLELPGADCARLLFWGVPPQYEGDS